jgi:thiamine biosynthesis lipoprotein
VALAPQPGGEPWRVGVRHPRHEDALIATLDLSSGGMATSGDYERFAMVDGVRHHHILDPRTGQSTAGFSSVTVIGPNATIAGSATTIAMLRGEAEGLAWLRDLGLRFLAVTGDGRVIEGP